MCKILHNVVASVTVLLHVHPSLHCGHCFVSKMEGTGVYICLTVTSSDLEALSSSPQMRSNSLWFLSEEGKSKLRMFRYTLPHHFSICFRHWEADWALMSHCCWVIVKEPNRKHEMPCGDAKRLLCMLQSVATLCEASCLSFPWSFLLGCGLCLHGQGWLGSKG